MRLAMRLFGVPSSVVRMVGSILFLAAACSSSPGGTGTGGASGQEAGAGGALGDAATAEFLCPGTFSPGDCSAVPVGLVCSFDPASPTGHGGAIACACLPSDGGQAWQCAPPGPCAGTGGPPTSGLECPLSSVSAIAAFGGCKYFPRTACFCEPTDGGGKAAWSCTPI